MKAGAIFVDHTTASAEVARELAAAAQRNAAWHFIDAPVSGGQAGAINGALTVMCGGDAAAFAAAKPVAMAFAQGDDAARRRAAPASWPRWSTRSRSPGWCRACRKRSPSAERAGLDMKAVLDVIGKGAAQSWQMDNRGPTMIEGKFDFGFAVDWMRKDLGLVLDEARRNGARLPVTALVDQFYADMQAAGRPARGHVEPDQAPALSGALAGLAAVRGAVLASSASVRISNTLHDLDDAADAARDLGGARRPRARWRGPSGRRRRARVTTLNELANTSLASTRLALTLLLMKARRWSAR